MKSKTTQNLGKVVHTRQAPRHTKSLLTPKYLLLSHSKERLIHFGYGSTTFLYHHKRSGTETDSISCNLPSRSVRGRFAPRNLAKTTVFMHEQQPYPIWFCPCTKAIWFSIVKIVKINGL